MLTIPNEASLARAELTACLHRVSLGERSALADLYQRTSAKLFGLCVRILLDRAEAEDVLQDVYLTVWQKAAQFDETREVSPITWLAAITRNRALDRLRTKKRQFTGLDQAADVADLSPLADIALQTSEADQRLAACLENLDNRAATAIRSAFFGGQTYESLAKTAAMPIGSMKSLIRRGLIQLKACLES
jgi:RNA polymerase sigma-70 factor (ECF subfamily)